jgi:hypothetical protein
LIPRRFAGKEPPTVLLHGLHTIDPQLPFLYLFAEIS